MYLHEHVKTVDKVMLRIICEVKCFIACHCTTENSLQHWTQSTKYR